MEDITAQFHGFKMSSETTETTDSGFVGDEPSESGEVECKKHIAITKENKKSSVEVATDCGFVESSSSSLAVESVVPKQVPQNTSRLNLQKLPTKSLYHQEVQDKVPLMYEQDADGDNDCMTVVSQPDEPNHLHLAALIIDNASKVELLNLQNKNGMTALILAVLCRNKFAIQRLRVAGADPNKCDYLGNSAVFYAAFYGHLDELLALTTNISEETVRAYASPLKRAVESADINIRNCEGKTALYVAAERDRSDIIQVLRQMCADPNLTENSAGRTALHVAVELGNYECVLRLLKFPTIDVNALTYAERTPLDCTEHLEESSRKAMVALLLEYSAKKGPDSKFEDSDKQYEDSDS